jgi:hypothetical protein
MASSEHRFGIKAGIPFRGALSIDSDVILSCLIMCYNMLPITQSIIIEQEQFDDI